MAEQRVQRRLAAVVAADVVGYSRHMGADEAGTLARLSALRRELLHPKVAEYGGRIVKTAGDGTLIEFPSAVDAVQHAVDVQQALTRRNADLAADARIEIRMGINLGDVIVEGDDIFGEGVNVAARLESLAEPGGICVSAIVYESVRGKLDIAFSDLGAKSLKNIAEPVHVYGVAPEQGGAPTAAALTESMFRRPAVAVLPFENLSGDPEQDYFADGLTEDIITALSLWRSFPVIARNSSFSYKGASPDIRKVGEELGARYVIEGSVRKAGGRVRVNAQLINAETGHHVWAERYDRDLDDIFALQDELTERIAATVAPEIERSVRTASLAAHRIDLDAWDLFQRGMAHLYENTKEGIARARALFLEAIESDSRFAKAHAWLAFTYLHENYLGYTLSPEVRLKLGLESAKRAVALDNQDPVAHWILGIAYSQMHQSDRAKMEQETAVELNPLNHRAICSLGNVCTLLGEPERGISLIEKGLRLSPRDVSNHVYFGFMARAHFAARRYDEAVEWARRSIHHKSDAAEPYLTLAASLGQLGRRAEGRKALEAFEALKPGDPDQAPQISPELASAADNDHFLDGLRKVGWKG